MKPIEFKEQNKILGAPLGMTSDECGLLPVFTDGNECVSVWELSEDDLKKIIETKCIYVGVLSGETQPPIFISVETPFVETKNNGKWKIYILNVCNDMYWVIAESETRAIGCLCEVENVRKNGIDSIREATLDEIKTTSILRTDEMKMPTLMDYYLNYNGLEAQIICSTLNAD